MEKKKNAKAQFDALQRAIETHGMKPPDFYRGQLGITKETFNNWSRRGIPANKLHDVARRLRLDPDKLKEGVYKPLDGPDSDSEPPLTDEGYRVGLAYDSLPESLQRHIDLIINDYIANIIPALQEMYANASLPDQNRINRILEDAQKRDLDSRSSKKK